MFKYGGARLVEIATVVGLALAITAQIAFADNDAERFAQGVIDQGFAILRDDSASDNARRSRFHDFILGHVEARKTALFTLGVYRRGAPDAALEAFVGAFREYSTAIYETHLEDYKNATLRVSGSIENKPGDVTVNTLADDPSLREPVRIAFRLMRLGSDYKIVDVQAAGIWLSIEQRDQFASMLAKNNGDIAALTSMLIERTARIRAGETS